jgi:phenylpropionate dioxygenase-like ring-hydroxylating dioxygenase large terminal subunit
VTDKGFTQEMVNDRIDKGLRNLWHPVLPSWALHDAPVGLTRLAQNIVLWRDTDGKVHALEDRCPHRGARLSLGWNLGDRVACWYHGVQVGGDGSVVAVPAVDECAMSREREVHAFPVEERHDAIFLYFGDGVGDAPPLSVPAELTSDKYSHMLCTSQWKCNYRYAVDNVMDPMHGAYLHARSHSMAEGAKTAKMQTRKTETGFVFEKIDQSGLNFDWVEWGESDSLWMRLAIPYQKKYGPGGPFTIVGFVTPIDENNTMVFFWRVREVEGWQRSVWRFLYRNRLEGLHWEVLEQDRVLLENMAPAARDQEYLYQHDIGISQVRRRLETMARQQLSAEAAASRAEG